MTPSCLAKNQRSPTIKLFTKDGDDVTGEGKNPSEKI